MKIFTILILLTTLSMSYGQLYTNGKIREKTGAIKQRLYQDLVTNPLYSVHNITRAPFNIFNPAKYHVIICYPNIKQDKDWKRKRNEAICGGSLIRKDKILTAGHCVVDTHFRPLKPYDIVILHGSRDVFGMSGGKIYYVRQIIVSTKYNAYEASIQYDIAILILDGHVDGVLDSDFLKLAKATPAQGTFGMFSGYGRFYNVSSLTDLKEIGCVSRH